MLFTLVLEIVNFVIQNQKYSGVFSARQHVCYSALYAIARPSVRPSVCLSITRVDQSKTVEVRITQPSPQSSLMTLSFLTLDVAAKFETEDGEWERRKRQGYEKFAHYMAASIVLRFTRGRHFRTISLLVCLPGIVLWFTRQRLSRADLCVSKAFLYYHGNKRQSNGKFQSHRYIVCFQRPMHCMVQDSLPSPS